MEYDYQPQIFGLYSRQVEKVNGRSFYISDFKDYKDEGYYGISWCGDSWWIQYKSWKGQCIGFGYDVKLQNTACPQIIQGYTWWLSVSYGWKPAGKGLNVRCVSVSDDDRKTINGPKFVPSTQKFSGTTTSTAIHSI